jgi:heme oxygenase
MSEVAPVLPSPIRSGLRPRPVPTAPATCGLAARLREGTAAEHREVEAALALPGAIRDMDDSRAVLLRFRALYAPLCRELRAVPGWPRLGLDPEERCPVSRLDRDLSRLGAAAPADAPAGALPRLGTFPAALGALYVVEGSTLGGQVILRDLRARLGPALGGADAFFAGHGPATGALWQAMRRTLDQFGQERPDAADEVVEAAARTFRAIGAWMAPAGVP